MIEFGLDGWNIDECCNGSKFGCIEDCIVGWLEGKQCIIELAKQLKLCVAVTVDVTLS